jgi:hypothetical protein
VLPPYFGQKCPEAGRDTYVPEDASDKILRIISDYFHDNATSQTRQPRSKFSPPRISNFI